MRVAARAVQSHHRPPVRRLGRTTRDRHGGSRRPRREAARTSRAENRPAAKGAKEMNSAGLDRPALLLLVLLASAAVRAGIVFAGVAGLGSRRISRGPRQADPALLLAARALRRRGDARAHRDFCRTCLGAGRRRPLIESAGLSPVTPPVTPPTEPFSAASLPTPPPLARMATVTAPSWPSGRFPAPSTGIPPRIAWPVRRFPGEIRSRPSRMYTCSAGRAALAAGRSRRLEAHAPPRESRRANRHLMGDGTPAGARRVARHDARAATARSRRARGAAHDVDRRSVAIVLPVGWRNWSCRRPSTPRSRTNWRTSSAAMRSRNASPLCISPCFWFSPFSWWLHQHLAQLAQGRPATRSRSIRAPNSTQYAETLLGFFAQLSGEPRRAQWHAVAMARGTDANRRIEQILAWRRGRSERLATSLVYGVMLLAVPVAALTASAGVMVPPVPAQSRATAIPARWTPAAPAQDPNRVFPGGRHSHAGERARSSAAPGAALGSRGRSSAGGPLGAVGPRRTHGRIGSAGGRRDVPTRETRTRH